MLGRVNSDEQQAHGRRLLCCHWGDITVVYVAQLWGANMKKAWVSGVAFAALVTASVADAQDGAVPGMFTGQRLYALATTPRPANNYSEQEVLFVYYVMGLLETLISVVGGGPSSPTSFSKLPVCLPVGISAMQAADIIKQYLADHPKTRHQPAATLSILALMDAYPCPAPSDNPK